VRSHRSSTLNEVGDVHRHFVNLGVVELLDVLKIAFVLLGDKVDGHSFTTETTSTPDPVDVILSVGGQVVVDDERDLLDVDASGEEIGGDENARRS